jgi:signal transduction histidine kinase
MIRLVTNIKDFLRLGGKRPKPQREEVDLVKCYKEAYALFREDVRDLMDGSDLPVEMGTDPTEPLKNGTFVGPVPNFPNFVAVGDETLVVQILWNLIGNDLKYALPFGPVRVRFYREGGFVCVELADEGQGMSKREMARAFDRYYRAKTVLESGKGGFGIGLCTAKEFAVAMGGTLSVGTNPPKGCVFTLELPAI